VITFSSGTCIRVAWSRCTTQWQICCVFQIGTLTQNNDPVPPSGSKLSFRVILHVKDIPHWSCLLSGKISSRNRDVWCVCLPVGSDEGSPYADAGSDTALCKIEGGKSHLIVGSDSALWKIEWGKSHLVVGSDTVLWKTEWSKSHLVMSSDTALWKTKWGKS